MDASPFFTAAVIDLIPSGRAAAGPSILQQVGDRPAYSGVINRMLSTSINQACACLINFARNSSMQHAAPVRQSRKSRATVKIAP
jgi:hypothetical protein